jgi:signal peptidase I
VSALRVGDVITYTPPPGAPIQSRVTHRIVSIRGRVLVTKGDSNRSRDPWSFTPRGRTEARVAFHLPLLGYVLAALSLRWLRMLIVGVPALLVGADAVSRLRLARSAEA